MNHKAHNIKRAAPFLRSAIDAQRHLLTLAEKERALFNCDSDMLNAWESRMKAWLIQIEDIGEAIEDIPFMLPPPTNHHLVEHGIFQDESDYRIHVCFLAQCVYIFPTKSGMRAIETGHYSLRTAGQKGVDYVTSEGYPVPWRKIEGCREIEIPFPILHSTDPGKNESNTSSKGRAAAECVKAMMRQGLIPIKQAVLDVDDFDMQVAGTDIKLVSKELDIQIKCDYRGGGHRTGITTGNLYLEVRESNPLKMY